MLLVKKPYQRLKLNYSMILTISCVFEQLLCYKNRNNCVLKFRCKKINYRVFYFLGEATGDAPKAPGLVTLDINSLLLNALTRCSSMVLVNEKCGKVLKKEKFTYWDCKPVSSNYWYKRNGNQPYHWLFLNSLCFYSFHQADPRHR